MLTFIALAAQDELAADEVLRACTDWVASGELDAALAAGERNHSQLALDDLARHRAEKANRGRQHRHDQPQCGQ